MAKTHKLFKRFNDAIKLSDSKEAEVKRSRDAIRDSVKGWMSEHDHGSVKFHMQGSVAMRTAINPIDDNEYDIDDGVYLEQYEDTPKDEWPTCETVHNWIKNAVVGQTVTDPIDKNACVRVPYKHGYHVDIPIYILNNERAFLAHKRDGWLNSDAKEFKNWLSDECEGTDGQLRRLIRYLKRWKDEMGVDMKGIELTILAAENYEQADGDDDALRYTVENMLASLEESFSCVKPVAPGEDLLESSSETKIDGTLTALKKLRDALTSAHFEDDEHVASKTLKSVLGGDFPEGESSSSEASVIATAAPGILRRDGRSG